ncbi:MAG: U32 family peptidase, partial [Moritella sp.]|uniref:peptidase U32 family protein n=1 Tax=Moritella sp. TaxID=78556 RepID=UPI001DB611C6
MSRKIELLAPGGDVEAIKAAIVAGANAVYCGLDMFNARNRASNLSFDELNGVLRLAHEHSCEVFLTLNVVILEHEVVSLVRLLNKLVNSGIDGIIVQDLGVFNIVKKHFPSLHIHASTQLTTHNEGQVLFLHKIGATRVNLSRELNLSEIKQLTTVAHDHDVLTEVFVHGALCIAFSGQCYSSSVSVGNSGNRGRCSQACRDEYEVTAEGHRFPLNLKDNSAYFDLPQLVDAGVDSLKVEGRIKGAHYVYTVVDTWRKQINSFVESGKLLADDGNLHKVFNRSFTNSFLQGDLNKTMFTDNPRDNSVNYAVEKSDAISVVQIHDVKQDLYTDKNALGAELAEKIKDLSIDKIALTLAFSAKENSPLTVNIMAGNTSFEVKSASVLRIADEISITPETVEKRFRSFNNATFDLAPMNFDNFDANLTVPFKELTELKNQVAFLLNGSREVVKHVDVPALPKHPKIEETPKLSLLIANVKDLHLADVT